ncbi:hypothetical protein RA29_01760 [Tateyamaria sp. ANG-S1]|nr:hypothetical protein RA29_01760 [Tateyamaria sp. ANG-S1]
MLSFELIKSEDFSFEERVHNIACVIPNGVMQVGYGSNMTQTALTKYPTIKCFVGTATAIG